MTLKTRSALITEANTNLPDNSTQEISPADVRNICKDIIDSYISKSGDNGILDLLQYSNTFEITDPRQLVYAGSIKGISIYKGSWNSTDFYSSDDVVLHQLQTYQAINNNTNSEPGVGMDWLLQGVDEGAYSINWAGSLLPPTQQSIWNWSLTLPTILEADFDSVYYRLDGLYHLEGDMNAYSNNIDNLGSIGVGALAGQSYAGQQALINAIGNGAEVPFIHGLFQNENSSGRSQFIVSSENYPDISFVTMTHGSAFGHNYYAPNKPEMSDAGFGILAMQGSESQGLLLGTASNKPVYIMANNTMYWLFGPTGNTGLASGVDFSDGVTVTCFGEATTEPTTPATQGALLWAKGAILKTNTNININDTSKYFYWGTVNAVGSARISYDSIGLQFVFERWDTITSTYILIQDLS